jgi:hypothetical protein
MPDPYPFQRRASMSCFAKGLQYFFDRKGALREMMRVLTPGGRLALSVWRPLERLPLFVALVDALEHHLGADVAAPLHAAFTISDADELRSLITDPFAKNSNRGRDAFRGGSGRTSLGESVLTLTSVNTDTIQALAIL